jgi:hypothetical protein
MKFIIDSTAKSISIIGEITFEELEQIKIFIGDDYKKWIVKAESSTTTVETDKWIPFPVFPNPIPLQPYYNPYGTNPNPNVPLWIVCEAEQNKFSFIGSTSALKNSPSLFQLNSGYIQ